jgi:hypothetical protein
MSAIERSMIVVETGSSIAIAAKPKNPPAAPLAADASLCAKSDDFLAARGLSRSVATAA